MFSRSAFALLVVVASASGVAAFLFWNLTTAVVACASLLLGAFAASVLMGRKRGGVELVSPVSRDGGSSSSAVLKDTELVAAADGAYEADEKNVVSSGALLKAMMESMREGVLVVDGGRSVMALNASAREIFGGDEEEAVSRRLSELTRHPLIHGAFQSALERGERAEVRVEMGDAERRVFDLCVAPLETGAGGVGRGAIGVFFNITRLERLERVRQEFLSNVSHELRTPLTAIITFVESLEAGAIDDPSNNRRFLSIIRRNAERMHNLIDDILELSAIETGAVAIEPDSVHLHTLVGDVFTSLRSRAAEASVELRNEVGAQTSVHADARRLEQMLTNLVDNAIKFNREGGAVTVSHERTARGDRIHVADTGEGIAPEHLPRIFERFYRVDRARSRALGGTGLGLAIVKHLARAHGGEATVRSTAGQGSTFTIELPAD